MILFHDALMNILSLKEQYLFKIECVYVYLLNKSIYFCPSDPKRLNCGVI